ncbi:MAG: hypothetical protein JWN53_584, partial [Gemmatimonadetes bacterium]|nr:hypothetical protein [Gemmatimonadota bacterium]
MRHFGTPYSGAHTTVVLFEWEWELELAYRAANTSPSSSSATTRNP